MITRNPAIFVKTAIFLSLPFIHRNTGIRAPDLGHFDAVCYSGNTIIIDLIPKRQENMRGFLKEAKIPRQSAIGQFDLSS